MALIQLLRHEQQVQDRIAANINATAAALKQLHQKVEKMERRSGSSAVVK